jgi:hypothetical protein
MIKIYTLYSDTHRDVYENFFKKSIRSLYTKEQLPIRTHVLSELKGTGEYMTKEWILSLDVKVNIILTALEENKNGWFIYADSDIQFFKPFLKELEVELQDCDLVAQQDEDTLCAGFFAARSNDATLAFFKTIKQHFWHFLNDQLAFNEFKTMINYKGLDKEKYYTTGNYFDNKNDGTHNWDGTTNIIPPKNIVMHHANYVKGVPYKVKLLEMIKNNYSKL